jgi:hypothetical protein
MFDGARFTGHAWFNKARFTGKAVFIEAMFTVSVSFANSFVAHSALVDSSWPAGWRPADAQASVDGLEGTWHHLVKIEPEPDHSDDPPAEPSDD